MEKMLEYIKQISKVNTENIEPLTQLFLNEENICNDDEKIDSHFKEFLLENAPDCDVDCIIVPKTV